MEAVPGKPPPSPANRSHRRINPTGRSAAGPSSVLYNSLPSFSFLSGPLLPKTRIIAMSRVAVVPTLTTKRSPPNGEGVHEGGEGCPADQHPRPADCIDDPGPDAGRG